MNELAVEYAEQGSRLDEALRLIASALAHQPDNLLFLDTQGWILAKAGRLAEGKRALERCLELLPDYAEAKEHYRAVAVRSPALGPRFGPKG